MKFIKTKFFPPKQYIAIMILGILCFHKIDLNLKQIKHEYIHGEQYSEVLGISLAISMVLMFTLQWFWTLLLAPFVYYIWYSIEFGIKYLLYKDWDLAYKSISFEQEANYGATYHVNEGCYERYSFIWLKYLFCKYKRK